MADHLYEIFPALRYYTGNKEGESNEQATERIKNEVHSHITRDESKPRGLLNLPRSVNTNLAAYDSSVTLPGMYSSGNAGSGGQGTDPEAPAYIAPQTPEEPKPEPPRTRDVDAPDGNGSKGTQMSPKISLDDANGLLSRIGAGQLADVNSFLSEQLPVSPSEKPELPQEAVPVTEGGGGMVVEGISLAGNGNGYTVSPESTPQGGKITAGYDGKTELSPIETADNNRSVSVPGEEVPADPKNSGTNWGIKQQPSFERARRDAFLDLNNRGYGAIRAADAATGRFRQGDKFFYNVGGELQEVNEETYRQGQHRQLSADELKSGYVEGIKSTLVPADQPDVTNPYQSETGVTMPEGEAPDIPAGAAPINPVTTVDTDDTEFNINNQAPTYETQVDMKGKYFDKGDDE